MFDETYMRHKLKQRYNRRFFVGAHVALLIAGLFLPVVGDFLTALVFVLLIPHALYVAYREYHDWLERRIDREIYGHHQAEMFDKRKRYPESYEDTSAFRLTDDGEIEPVNGSKAKRGYDQASPVYTSRDRDTSQQPVKPRRRGRKDDTDEWDVKRLFKKVKDILD